MKIGNEEVELVTDFASLRAGMIVIADGCGICRRRHRGMLTRLSELPILSEPDAPAPWVFAPIIHGLTNVVVAKSTVDAKLVYRVVDPLLDAKPVTRAKELTR